MGTRRKCACWYKDKRLWIVRPPDWPKQCELSFTDKADMLQWARNNGYMLKDITPPKEASRHGKPYAANA